MSCLIKIISPKNFLISSGVILNYLSVLGETFYYCAFCSWYRFKCSVRNCIRSSPATELMTLTIVSGLSITYSDLWFQRKAYFLVFCQFTPNVTSIIIRALWLTIFFLFCTCLTITSKKCGRILLLFMWTSCGDIIPTVQNFIFTIIRDIRTYIPIFITHIKYHPFSEHKAMIATVGS
jgi:hypothetical protein